MVALRRRPQVAFVDGFVFDRHWVAIAGYLIDFKDQEHARVYTLDEKEWSRFDLDFDVCSVKGVTAPARKLFCLGVNGQVHIEAPGGPFEEQISDVERLGRLSNMSIISGVFYACGIGGQIYRRGQKGWEHFDQGVLRSGRTAEPVHLQCIHGTKEDNIYAVGGSGIVWYYNGDKWSEIQKFTTENLHWVRCVSNEEVYVCGSKATVFRGHLNHWEKLSVRPNTREGFWCVEFFNRKVYIAGNLKLYVVEGNEVVALDTGLSPAPDGNRLHANDGVLWSFGTYHLCFFDGKKWTYVKHPDNPE